MKNYKITNSYKIWGTQTFAILATFVAVIGCNNPEIIPPDEQSSITGASTVISQPATSQKDTFDQSPINSQKFSALSKDLKARVLFVIDSSVSMLQEEVRLTLDAPASFFDSVDAHLPGVDFAVSVITSNTALSGTSFVDDPMKHNMNATDDEKARESWCVPVGDPIFPLVNCEENWWYNGTAGYAPSEPNLGGVNFLTGLEVDRVAQLQNLMRVGLAGHWLENPLEAMGRYISYIDDPMFQDEDTNLMVIAMTDTQDSSHISSPNCEDPATGKNLCHGNLDSRVEVADPNDPTNFAFYADPNDQFYKLLNDFKGPDRLFFGAVAGVDLATAAATADCALELNIVETRLSGLIAKRNQDLGTNEFVEDICTLKNYDNFISAFADKLRQQLPKAFSLTLANVADIVASSVVVILNDNKLTLGTDYTFDSATGVVTLVNTLNFSDMLEVQYAAPTVSFALSKKADPESIEVFFGSDANAAESSANWSYDEQSNSVVFASLDVAGDPGEKIIITYFTLATESTTAGQTTGGFDVAFAGGGGTSACGLIIANKHDAAASSVLLLLGLVALLAVRLDKRKRA